MNRLGMNGHGIKKDRNDPHPAARRGGVVLGGIASSIVAPMGGLPRMRGPIHDAGGGPPGGQDVLTRKKQAVRWTACK